MHHTTEQRSTINLEIDEHIVGSNRRISNNGTVASLICNPHEMIISINLLEICKQAFTEIEINLVN